MMVVILTPVDGIIRWLPRGFSCSPHTVESGSFNMTRSAASRNSENVLVIKDVPEVAQAYLQHWQSRWDGGTEWHSSY